VSAGPATALRIGRRSLRVSNLGKVLYPATGFTKGQVIEYVARIAPVMIKHLRGHPLSLRRFPDGVDAPGFFEKNCPAHRPEWVRTAPLGGDGESRGMQLCVAREPADLVWLANLAALEIHPYLFTVAAPASPTWMVFDLDPGPGVAPSECARLAVRLRGLLEAVGLRSVAKTSGGKGLHLLVPLNTRGIGFEDSKGFARAVAATLERDDPKRVTASMAKEHRPGRVFIDWSQNDRNKTTGSVYSLRGRERPTVSAPLAWGEVEAGARKKTWAPAFEAEEVLERVERLGDVASEALTLKQRLPTDL
jgi:bifunctional non-homologous end joining protein LigD